MQNLIFSRCLIFQPSFIRETEISVTGICLTVGFTFSASNQLPDRGGVVLGICTPLLFTDDIQSNIWGAKYLAYWKPLDVGMAVKGCDTRVLGEDGPFCSFTWGYRFLAGWSKVRAADEVFSCTHSCHTWSIMLFWEEAVFQLSLCFVSFRGFTSVFTGLYILARRIIHNHRCLLTGALLSYK